MHTPPDGMPVWVGVLVCVVSSDALRSSILTDLKQRGACNQREEGFRADCVLSLVDTRFVLTGEQYSSRKGALTQNCILVLKSCKHVVMYT